MENGCPQCGVPVEEGQIVCVECGARLNLVYGKTPSPLVPAGIVGGVVLVAGIGLAIALSSISNSSEKSSKAAAPVASAPRTTAKTTATQPPTKTATTPAAPTTTTPATPAIDRSAIEVSVLSGTGVPGIGKRTGKSVKAKGYKLGTVANSAAPSPHSVVLYAPGKHREANDVAKSLGIARIKALDVDNRRIAKGADVVVVIGGDERGAPR